MLCAEAIALGAAPEQAAAIVAARPSASQERGVWPDNWPAVQAFLAVATQWRVAAIGGGLAGGRMLVVGLDYQGARAALDALAIEVTPRLWADLQVMEAEALDALNG